MLRVVVFVCGSLGIGELSITNYAFASVRTNYDQARSSPGRHARDMLSESEFNRARGYDDLGFLQRYSELKDRAKKIAKLGAELDECTRKLIQLRRDQTLSAEKRQS